jgi:hypothetical protein
MSNIWAMRSPRHAGRPFHDQRGESQSSRFALQVSLSWAGVPCHCRYCTVYALHPAGVWPRVQGGTGTRNSTSDA